MKEIDEMLNQWIHNTIIRASLREKIVKEILYSDVDNNRISINQIKACTCND